MKKLTPVLAAVLLLATLGAGTASAANVTLKASGQALKPGAEIRGDNSGLVFETTKGNLECTINVVKGTLLTNGKATDEAEITSATFKGTETGELCKTSALGPRRVTATGLPWFIAFKSTGKTTIKGTPEVSWEEEFPAAGGLKCDWGSKSVKDTFAFNQNPLNDGIEAQ